MSYFGVYWPFFFLVLHPLPQIISNYVNNRRDKWNLLIWFMIGPVKMVHYEVHFITFKLYLYLYPTYVLLTTPDLSMLLTYGGLLFAQVKHII